MISATELGLTEGPWPSNAGRAVSPGDLTAMSYQAEALTTQTVKVQLSEMRPARYGDEIAEGVRQVYKGEWAQYELNLL